MSVQRILRDKKLGWRKDLWVGDFLFRLKNQDEFKQHKLPVFFLDGIPALPCYLYIWKPGIQPDILATRWRGNQATKIVAARLRGTWSMIPIR